MGWVWVIPCGVPRFTPYSSAPSTSTTPPPAGDWPPPNAPAYDPHDYYSSLPRTDYFADPDDRMPDEDHPPLDPSAPPISLDSFRSEYRRMIEYICGLFPQAMGVPPVEPPLRALFEFFFARSTLHSLLLRLLLIGSSVCAQRLLMQIPA